MVEKDVLVEYAKKLLRECGYKKKRTRWLKEVGGFTVSFLIQGSFYDKQLYYIRPGVYINVLLPNNLFYGDFHTEIPSTTPEEIFSEFFSFVDAWTNPEMIKQKVLEFIEWDRRNPLEKRRAGQVDYMKDPPPADCLFGIPKKTLDYVVMNFN